MSASIDANLGEAWVRTPPGPNGWDELPTDGSHAWLGLLLMLGSAAVAIRGTCWVMAEFIRLVH